MRVPTTDKPVRYCGRLFTTEEMGWIRRLIASEPKLNRAQLSRRICRELHWLRPDGRSKEMSCRVAMLRMERDGLITLPRPEKGNGNGRNRPRLIGWDDRQRRRNLHRIVNNSRFLILPWVEVRNLASRILAAAAKRLSRDWQDRYGYEPVLLETFVDRDRFQGTCYRAANWIYTGETQGRGKLDRQHRGLSTVKHIYLYPLHKHFRQKLSSTPDD